MIYLLHLKEKYFQDKKKENKNNTLFLKVSYLNLLAALIILEKLLNGLDTFLFLSLFKDYGLLYLHFLILLLEESITIIGIKKLSLLILQTEKQFCHF
jgi:hypothetical protein